MGKKRGSATKGGANKGQQQTKQGFLAGPRSSPGTCRASSSGSLARSGPAQAEHGGGPDHRPGADSLRVCLGPRVPESGALIFS